MPADEPRPADVTDIQSYNNDKLPAKPPRKLCLECEAPFDNSGFLCAWCYRATHDAVVVPRRLAVEVTNLLYHLVGNACIGEGARARIGELAVEIDRILSTTSPIEEPAEVESRWQQFHSNTTPENK